MAKLKLKDGYSLVQRIDGDGVVKVLAHKVDGSEEDVEVLKFVKGYYEIEEGKSAKLVYQVIQGLEKFGVYASESTVPGEEDVDLTSDTELANYVEVVVEGVSSDPEDHAEGFEPEAESSEEE